MPIWCPKCNSMLADGTEKCPVCGEKLKTEKKKITPGMIDDPDFDKKDFVYTTLYILMIGILPIVIALILGMILVLVLR